MGKTDGPRVIRNKKDSQNYVLKDGDIVDYTKWRIGSSDRGGAKIVKCPKCGRHGLLVVQAHISDCYHIRRYETKVAIKNVDGKELRKPFDVFIDLESCYLGSRSIMGDSDPAPGT